MERKQTQEIWNRVRSKGLEESLGSFGSELFKIRQEQLRSGEDDIQEGVVYIDEC